MDEIKQKSVFQRIKEYKQNVGENQYKLTIAAVLILIGIAIYFIKSFLDAYGWPGAMFIAIVVMGIYINRNKR